jgi:hypothetical protein
MVQTLGVHVEVEVFVLVGGEGDGVVEFGAFAALFEGEVADVELAEAVAEAAGVAGVVVVEAGVHGGAGGRWRSCWRRRRRRWT